MPSLCGGYECLFCKGAGGCLAGNGDDDFVPMDMTEITQMIDSKYHGRWKRSLADQEIMRLMDMVTNGYSRSSYKMVAEKIY